MQSLLMRRRERQNFDQAGHYSRPDVTRLVVNRNRQAIASQTGIDRPAHDGERVAGHVVDHLPFLWTG
jgi:hypothetical protein